MMLKSPSSHTKGFTLIELLVVIAIIGLLSSVVLSSMNKTRIKGRDTRRVADMRAIQTAIEAYANDNGRYPNSNGAWTSFDSPAYAPNPIVTPAAANLTTALQPYLAQTPRDPVGGAGDTGYLYIGDANNYCILFYRVPENMNNFPTNLWNMSAGRCGSVNASGQCTGGINSVYMGVGIYAGGC
jgi:type II secretion system protein G